MKAAILTLCILTGVVDSQEEEIMIVELQSPIEAIAPGYITIDSRSLEVSPTEGDKIHFEIFVDETMTQYCHNPL